MYDEGESASAFEYDYLPVRKPEILKEIVIPSKDLDVEIRVRLRLRELKVLFRIPAVNRERLLSVLPIEITVYIFKVNAVRFIGHACSRGAETWDGDHEEQ